MKRLVSLVPIVILAAAAAAAAQTVEIRPEKITYTRPEPLMEHKSTFTINHPRVTAASPAVSARINGLLSYEKAFDFTIEEEKTELQWLEEADFEVNFNRGGILSIELRIEGTAAYPDQVVKRLNIDTTRGIRLFPKDVFRNLPTLAARIKRMQTAEIAAAKRAMRNDPDAQDLDPNEMFARANFRTAELNAFQITDRGVVFYYNYGFPHVVKALQPDGVYMLSWREIRPFIKPGSLLAKAAR